MKSGFVAIAGRPNAGKSTLLNHVLGAQLSIVTAKAQTTRERVLGILTEDQGQLIFIDTPGIHRAKEGGINAFMMKEVEEALKDVSAVWYLVDPKSKLEHEKRVLELLSRTQAPVFILLNKGDVARGRQGAELLDAVVAQARTLGLNLREPRKISALKGSGVDDLLHESWDLLPEGPLYYPDPDQMSDRPVRFFVAEKIREQLLLKLGEELPYSCAVLIERFDESAKPLRIEATIFVERDSQKGMVIGKGGQKIKEIGQEARRKIEAFLDQHVFLGLQVKVLKDWSRDPESLKRMGYDVPAKGKRPA